MAIVGLPSEVEIFEAPGGDIYLLGLEEDHVLEGAPRGVRAALEELQRGPLTLREARDLAGPELLEALSELGLLVESETHTAVLPADAAERYDRQLAYFAQQRPGAEVAMQQDLMAARVVVIGVGGLGSWVAAGLACAGVGELVLVDFDTVELSNLNRQVLFGVGDLGTPKVAAAKRFIANFNPGVSVRAVAEAVSDGSHAREVVAGASFVVATADHPPHLIARWINRACLAEGVPYISASQYPPFIRIGPTVMPGRPGCYECGETAARARFAHYDELVAQRASRPPAAPTLGPASGAIGAMLSMEIVHHLTGAAEPATAGRAVTFDMRTWESTTTAVQAAPGCPACTR